MENYVKVLFENIQDFIGTEGVVKEEYAFRRDSLCAKITALLDGKEYKEIAE